jgi:hypothetical protein
MSMIQKNKNNQAHYWKKRVNKYWGRDKETTQKINDAKRLFFKKKTEKLRLGWRHDSNNRILSDKCEALFKLQYHQNR